MIELVDVIYEDDCILVVNKPSGIATQAPTGIDSMEARVREYLLWQRRDGNDAYVGIPHRLDRAASGCLLFALRRKWTHRICKQFERREVCKTYAVLVEGRVQEESATWLDSMRKIPGRAIAEICDANHTAAKQAVLHYERIAAQDEWSCLKIRLETGRTHQIRVQCASRAHPVVGDKLYGATSPFGPSTEDPRQRHIALHSHQIGLVHPKSRQSLNFEAKLPTTWSAYANFE